MREIASLNGQWDFCPVYSEESNLNLPEIKNYEKIVVPSSWRWKMPDGGFTYKDFAPFNVMDYPEEWCKANTGVYRRFFTVHPEENRQLWLNVENVSQQAAVYVNGKQAAVWDEMYLPLRTDITKFVKDGENELQIVCTGFEETTLPSGQTKTTGLTGSWYGQLVRGLWGGALIETLPKLHLSDVIIRTSVRNKTIEIITKLSQPDETAGITAIIKDGNTQVKRFGGKPGSITENWEDPVLWDTDNPHLYTLEVTLYQNEKAIDQKTERFGFREIITEGPNFYLNGVRINLRGDSWHFQGATQTTKEYALNWYAMCKQNGVNYIRLHAEPHPVCYLEAADEAGMLIVDETAIYGSGKSMDAANEKYIERCKIHAERLVKRDKNHPCIVFWSLQNEMRWVDGRDVFKTHIPRMMQRMNELDPTRQVSLDGDNRLISYENTQIESLHYNIDGTLEQWKREKPLTIGEHGGMWYICPQNASAYAGLQVYDNFEPCAIGFAAKERLYVEDARRKDVSGISTFNFAYYYMYSMPDKDIWVDNAPFQKIPKYSMSINNGYLMDYPVCRPNPVMEYMHEAFRPVTIIRREYNNKFYGGREIQRTFDVYNDTRKPQNCTLKYSFKTSDKTLKSGEEHFIQPPAERKEWKTQIPAIMSENVETVTLTVELQHNATPVFLYDFVYQIVPSKIKQMPIECAKQATFYGSDTDFIFWHPEVTEERPDPIIMQNFRKPADGDYTFVLESSAGDYADGGDLWSPLMTADFGKGHIVFCQLEVMANFETVPQACLLLRNILKYAAKKAKTRTATAATAATAIGQKAKAFLENTGVVFGSTGSDDALENCSLAVADVTAAENKDQRESLTGRLKAFLQNGGTLVTLPFDKQGAELLSEVCGKKITVTKAATAHLKKICEDEITLGVSPVDLYRNDKVPMSPRQVENTLVAEHTAEAEGAKVLLTDVPGTPWEDYYGKGICSEYCRIPLVSMNRESTADPKPYLSVMKAGKGTIVLCQLSADGKNEKDRRVYARLLANLGAKVKNNLFDYEKTENEYAFDYFMTLPVQSWQDYAAAKAYYTDPQFSLNNLGEGLYGWMLKVEKNPADGFITVPDSEGKKYFLTCFADKTKDNKTTNGETGNNETVKAKLDCNGEATLYVNGEKQNDLDNVPLKAGVNRIVIEASAPTTDPLAFCLILLDHNGQPSGDIRTYLTIDKVDPM